MGCKMRFEPGIYEHASRFLEATPWQVSRDARLLSDAHVEAAQYYSSQTAVMGIDIYNLEAESLGARVRPAADDAVPVICQPLYNDIAALNETLMESTSLRPGRFELILEAASRFQAVEPDKEIKIPVCGPVSLAAGLLGLEALVLASVSDAQLFLSVLDSLASYLGIWCSAIGKAGHAIIIFDSAAAPPLFSPVSYTNLILPTTARLIESARISTRKPVSYFVGGNSALIAGHMMKTGADQLLCPFETDQARFLEIMRGAPDIDVRLNIDSAVFLNADPGAALAQIEHAISLAKIRGDIAIGTGVLPYHAVPATVKAARDYVISTT